MEKLKIPESLLKETKTNGKQIGIRLTQQENELLNKIARENNITISDVIRLAIKSLAKQLV